MYKRKNLSFHIIDVFAEEKYTGNQLAVVEDASLLSKEEMQKISKEFNYSETSFILSNKNEDEGFKVRIFTPEREVLFAGHPTLGTAFVIKQKYANSLQISNKIILNLKDSQISVEFESLQDGAEILWMYQKPPLFGKIFTSTIICDTLNIEVEDIDTNFPIQEVSTGLPFIIVPLKTLNAIKKVKIDKRRYFELIEKTEAKAILIFTSETYNKQNNFNVRVFAEYYGVPEDPATGSANGCLAAYLVKNSYCENDSISCLVEQGYEIKRPSLIYLKARQKQSGIEVIIGGKVRKFAQGKLFIE